MFVYVIRVYVPFILLLRNMQKYNILELNEKLLPELQSIAEELGIKKVSSLKKEELVYRILDEQAIRLFFSIGKPIVITSFWKDSSIGS